MSNVNLTFATAMTAGDVFGMIKSAAPNSFNNGFPWEYGLYVPGVGGNHYTYGDNNVYDGFGSTQRVAYNPLTYAAHKFAITEWSLYNTYSATNNWGINRNANVILNRTSNTVNFSLGSNGVTIGTNTGSNWSGYSPEVILYNRVLSASERKQVNSYLAIKYGATIAQDYIASDGTTKVWDATVNATYQNNVFGIGKETAQGLHQRQSKSANTDNFFWIGNNNIVDNTLGNASGANNDIATDNTFLMVGDNNASLTGTVADWTGTGVVATKQMLRRAWKVQQTGTTGSVLLSFADNTNTSTVKLPSIASTLSVLISKDADFSTAGDNREVALTLNATAKRWEANVSFAADEIYFTVVSPRPIVPGGIVTDLAGWWNSDSNNGTAVDNTGLTTWLDKVGTNNFTQATAANKPIYKLNQINFNPSLVYNGTSQFYGLTTLVGNAKSIFMSAKYNAYPPNDYKHILYGPQPGGTCPTPYMHAGGNGALQYGPVGLVNDANGGWRMDGVTATDATVMRVPTATASSDPDVIVWNNSGASIYFGSISYQAGYTGRYFNGPIPEINYYQQKLSDADLNKVETYYAIKYGITLGTPSLNTVVLVETMHKAFTNASPCRRTIPAC
jgi:hypothetical protein